MVIKSLLILPSLIPCILAACNTQSPFYPPPGYNRQASEIWETLGKVEAALSTLVRSSTDLNRSSYSIEVTSSNSTLWSTFHTAKEKNATRPGAETVDETSRYRIASITKVFTVLGILQQHAAENLSLTDTVDKYLPRDRRNEIAGSMQWDKITLQSLASQLSGVPRNWTPDALPKCDSHKDPHSCTEELLDILASRPALFAPNAKSTYSNIAFELLGLVLANVTGTTYEEYITTSILQPLGMSQSSFATPPDSVSVLPKGDSWYFDVDMGVENPSGGLYVPSKDMSTFLRYILANYRDIADTKLNWLLPGSFMAGMGNFYGMPWEIFRTDKILLADGGQACGGRPVTFFTKEGGHPGYRTLVLLVPEYDLGITIFTAGDRWFLDEVREMLTVPLIRAADELAARQVGETYVGSYKSASAEGGAKFTLTYTPTHGLEISEWVVNSTDVLDFVSERFLSPTSTAFHAQLIPSGLYRDEEKQVGEVWRIANVVDKEASTAVWDDFYLTDVDRMTYAGRQFSDVVFWDKDEKTGMFGKVELTAFGVNVTRVLDQKAEEASYERQEL
ncbi:serine hydrolase domain-containing protein [Aspergillus clavatus NRRL 1]|uniref:Beta-lactamase family protein n=1 Tax=Aspergillus clavatus (strain ATCC 1007 / CBS 513.65 / DSM 816 / NCTC 3887 / NRRL 1 / QM 1276 / 107) TaxID=344612 RepID=A1C9H3_ASPCL|nr:beta-lactamase family protein [Aspergillus clavatus NRRL 1]EAW13497.1 beta-lactamase family protein [Aspergillus clavatus NRRL 1]